MMTMSEKEVRIEAFHRAAKSILGLFQAGEILTGRQENTLIDTIHDLQMGYNEWLMRQPLKEQTFPPDGET
ncbi:MAG: hypothetical protein ABI945_07405 [Nitrospirales bacterium]